MLRNWILTKNIAEKIGDYLFVHGGISKSTLDRNPTIQDLNLSAYKEMRAILFYNKTYYTDNETLGNLSPLWYRGYFTEPIISKIIFNNSLKQYDCKKIVVGHTRVSTFLDYDRKEGQLIAIDFKHPTSLNDVRGLLIEKGVPYLIQSGRLDDKEAINDDNSM